jgi:hypothetical protein
MSFARTLFLAVSLCAGGLATAAADAVQYADLGRGRMPTVPAIEDPNFQQAALYAHNVERRRVGVPDLVWSPELAGDALAWARESARVGRMEHAPQRTHGENLWMNTIDRRTVGSMIGGWSIERDIYIIGGQHPNVSTTGQWKDVGHYTQMVWASTTRVGCAIARGAQKDFLVCRYDPIGNWRGQMAYVPKSLVVLPEGFEPPVSASALAAAPVSPAAPAAAAPAASLNIASTAPVPAAKPSIRAGLD